jgi:hypothetical protein
MRRLLARCTTCQALVCAGGDVGRAGSPATPLRRARATATAAAAARRLRRSLFGDSSPWPLARRSPSVDRSTPGDEGAPSRGCPVLVTRTRITITRQNRMIEPNTRLMPITVIWRASSRSCVTSDPTYSGTLPCLRAGAVEYLSRSAPNAAMILLLVSRGSMMSSM